MNAPVVIRLTEGTQKFLESTHFPPTPEGAKYIAFTEDGQACWIEDITFEGFAWPKLQVISYYENVEIPD